MNSPINSADCLLGPGFWGRSYTCDNCYDSRIIPQKLADFDTYTGYTYRFHIVNFCPSCTMTTPPVQQPLALGIGRRGSVTSWGGRVIPASLPLVPDALHVNNIFWSSLTWKVRLSYEVRKWT